MTRRRRRRRRNARQGSTSTATHISSLGADLLLEIFLRLSSLATLVRAAFTCRAWRHAVASSPDFRRRFRALHPAPPLLGIFIDSSDDGADALYRPPCVPSFVPGGFRAWDLAGAVRGGDFFLASLLERSTKSSDPLWHILDCCGGRILVTDAHDYEDNRPLIVLNPLMRGSVHEFRCPSPTQDWTTTRFICQDEEPPSSFRVVLLAFSGSTLQPSVYSMDTGKWSALPNVDFPARTADDDGTSSPGEESSEKIWIDYQQKMHANGFVYWIYLWCGEENGPVDGWRYNLISLDTTTMEFSFAELPQCLRNPGSRWFTFQGGETEDGAACIVYSDGSNMFGVVKHTRGDDGVDRWVPHRVLRLEFDGQLERIRLGKPYYFCHNLSVVAVRDGYVYFATCEMLHDPELRCWFMSLCLATMEVEKLFERRYDGDADVYIMPWPPCLLAENFYGAWVEPPVPPVKLFSAGSTP